MKSARMLLVALVVTSPLTAVALATPSSAIVREDAPFAEAGLDQETTVGDRVLLDGGGSRSPSDDALTYNWTITGPNGTTVRPSCRTCLRTAFVPNRSGRYAVTLTVSDADGRSDSDTMYVEANSTAVPGVSVSGPSRVASDRPATFTATVRPGDAELTNVSWTVNDSSVKNTTLDGSRNASLEHTFASSGPARVNATVRDASGRERTATRTVEVVGRTHSGTSTSPPSLSVSGPRVLTGEAPFEGSYSLDGTDVDDVEAVTWRDGDGTRGSGTDLETEWEPGRHELAALADVGDDAYSASFENGTDVVADPRPSVSLTTSQSDGTLSGTVEATDEFGNLASAQLFVDDERIREWTSANGTTFETSFSVTLDENQNSNRVRVTATDERGQSTAETNQAGEPELVRSGFVNGPVDSYHERIDSDRYTAVHETVIDLNGADPSEVSPRLVPSGDNPELQKLSSVTRRYEPTKDLLTIESKWAGNAPESYEFSAESDHIKNIRSEFEVTYSNPEPRIEVLDEGEDSDNRAHLLYIDVSESFDPDGQSLHFQAQDRDREPGNPDKIALEFSHTPGLVITDEQQNSVELSSKLYDYWSPRFKGVEEVTEGPYKPSETIKFEVESETFNIADGSYDPSLELSLKGATGDVTNWRRGSHESNVGHDPNPLEADHPQYAGTVEVDAHSYLSSGIPYIGIGNVKETTWKSLPLVNVFEEDELKRNNVSIENIEYTKREIDEVTVSSRTGRIRHEAKGYNVEDTSKTLETITLERLHSKPPTVVDSKTFSSKEDRWKFLSTHPNWSPAGTTTQTRSEVVTKWFDTPRSAGVYTGERRYNKVCSGDSASMRGGRCVPIGSGEWITQYLHRFEEEVSETMYVAEKMESQSYWEPIEKVKTPREAAARSEKSDIRIGSRKYSKQWDMVRQTDDTIVSDSYDDPSDVTETAATVEFDRQYTMRKGPLMRDSSASNKKNVTVESRRGSVSFGGLKTKEEIVKSVKSGGVVSPHHCSIGSSVGC